MLTRSPMTSRVSQFCNSGATWRREVKYWDEELQSMVTWDFSILLAPWIISGQNQLFESIMTPSWSIPSIRSLIGRSFMRSSPVRVMLQIGLSIAKLVRNLTEVPEFQRKSSLHCPLIFSTPPWITNVPSFISILIHISLSAWIIYSVSSDWRNHVSWLIHDARAARMRSLLLIDFDPGRVIVFIVNERIMICVFSWL